MKLSEAIRLGSMLRPNQSYGAMFVAEENATCALGAAAEALGILDLEYRNAYKDGARAPADWRPVVLQPVKCPGCALKFSRVDKAVIHLNNRHRWSRARIADWIESLEAIVETPKPVHVGVEGR